MASPVCESGCTCSSPLALWWSRCGSHWLWGRIVMALTVLRRGREVEKKGGVVRMSETAPVRHFMCPLKFHSFLILVYSITSVCCTTYCVQSSPGINRAHHGRVHSSKVLENRVVMKSISCVDSFSILSIFISVNTSSSLCVQLTLP